MTARRTARTSRIKTIISSPPRCLRCMRGLPLSSGLTPDAWQHLRNSLFSQHTQRLGRHFSAGPRASNKGVSLALLHSRGQAEHTPEQNTRFHNTVFRTSDHYAVIGGRGVCFVWLAEGNPIHRCTSLSTSRINQGSILKTRKGSNNWHILHKLHLSHLHTAIFQSALQKDLEQTVIY